jgi:hypothetical protein
MMRVMSSFTLGPNTQFEEIEDYITSMINDSFQLLYNREYSKEITSLYLRGIVRVSGEEGDFLLSRNSSYDKKYNSIAIVVHFLDDDYINLSIDEGKRKAKKYFFYSVKRELNGVIKKFGFKINTKSFYNDLHLILFDENEDETYLDTK